MVIIKHLVLKVKSRSTLVLRTSVPKLISKPFIKKIKILLIPCQVLSVIRRVEYDLLMEN